MLTHTKYFAYIVSYLFISVVSSAQNSQFQMNGTAINPSGSAFELTQSVAAPWQNGSVWSKVKLDLSKSFTISGQMNFGTNTDGADGIAFVLQNNCAKEGNPGGGIGYKGILNSSMAVEFDTYQNITTWEQFNDPVYDHIAVEKNGDVVHSTPATPNPNNLFPPIQMDPVLTNVKTGAWYNYSISYNVGSKVLQVYFNNALRVTLPIDIQSSIFAGNQWVYWGFTSATAGNYNKHQVKINGPDPLKDTTICTGSVPVVLDPLAQVTNLALKKTVTVTAGTPALLVDGNMTTSWNSDNNVSRPAWLYVDLKTASDLDSVTINWKNPSFPTSYVIETSNNATLWTPIATVPTTDGGFDKVDLSSLNIQNVRYVRMYPTPITAKYEIYEFRVYGVSKYTWRTNNGTDATISPDIHSSSVSLTPAVTTTYYVSIPDACLGSTSDSITITVECVTPVTWLSFTAKASESDVLLSWSTATETNNKSFEILRSYDGISYEMIGTVPGYGNSTQIKNYTFTDINPGLGNNYYVLRQVDYDGKESYSEVRNVSFPASDLIMTQDNTKGFVLIVPDGPARTITYEVYAVTGAIVYRGKLDVSEGMHRIKVDLQLSTACYVVCAYDNFNINRQKIIITE